MEQKKCYEYEYFKKHYLTSKMLEYFYESMFSNNEINKYNIAEEKF